VTKTKSSFNLVFNTPEWVLIRDNSDEMQTMSVTNDAENVVMFLKENGLLFKDTILYYVDTMGRVDILEHDGKGNFTGFKSGFESEEEFYKNKKY